MKDFIAGTIVFLLCGLTGWGQNLPQTIDGAQRAKIQAYVAANSGITNNSSSVRFGTINSTVGNFTTLIATAFTNASEVITQQVWQASANANNNSLTNTASIVFHDGTTQTTASSGGSGSLTNYCIMHNDGASQSVSASAETEAVLTNIVYNSAAAYMTPTTATNGVVIISNGTYMVVASMITSAGAARTDTFGIATNKVIIERMEQGNSTLGNFSQVMLLNLVSGQVVTIRGSIASSSSPFFIAPDGAANPAQGASLKLIRMNP
jgi:hypothetical protein